MVQQEALDDLQAELESVREAIQSPASVPVERVNRLHERATELHQQAAGSNLEASLAVICDLIDAFRRSRTAQGRLRSAAGEELV